LLPFDLAVASPKSGHSFICEIRERSTTEIGAFPALPIAFSSGTTKPEADI
jgi:hypothetical protein